MPRAPYSRVDDARVGHQKHGDEDERVRRTGRQVSIEMSPSIQMRHAEP